MNNTKTFGKFLDKLFGWLDEKPTPKPVVAPAPKPPSATVIRMPHEGTLSPEAQRSIQGRVDKASGIILVKEAIKLLGYKMAEVADPNNDHNRELPSSQWQYYTVNIRDGIVPTCTCPDTWGRRYAGGCKHIMALQRFYAAAARLAHEEVSKVIDKTDAAKEAAMAQFLKSCIQVHLRRTSDQWRGSWMKGTELVTGSGTFSALGFTANDLLEYAGKQEYKITDPVQRREGSIFIQAHQDEWMRRRTVAAAQVEETIIEEDDVATANLGQAVAEKVRVEAAIKEPREAPEPQEPEPVVKPVYICAAVSAKGVMITTWNQGKQDVEYHTLKEGKTAGDTIQYLIKQGLRIVQVPEVDLGASGLCIMRNPGFGVIG
jgi:hypothetical protein